MRGKAAPVLPRRPNRGVLDLVGAEPESAGQGGVTAGIRRIQDQLVNVGDGHLMTLVEPGHRLPNDPLQAFLGGEPVFPGAGRRGRLTNARYRAYFR